MYVSPETCSQIIREFDQQGWHRTGTDVDRQSATWLAGRFEALGLSADLSPFPFERVDAAPCAVQVGDTEIEAVPLIDAPLPSPGTSIRGVLAESGGPGTIALVRPPEHGIASALDEARGRAYLAIVAVVEGHPAGVTLLNAWHYDAPTGPPILQVPVSHWERLSSAAAAGATVEVRCGADRAATSAYNVVATLPGSRPDFQKLVVLTPRSGWWHCAGERGGGIAIVLELARLARSSRFERDILFLATTGHELGFIGVQRYLDANTTLASDAAAWIHLGANIGASGSRLVVRTPSVEILEFATAAAESWRRVSPLPEYAVSRKPVGEAAIVHERGGSFISLVGAGFVGFHSTIDRWPAAIDAPAIATIGQGVFETLTALDGGGAHAFPGAG